MKDYKEKYESLLRDIDIAIAGQKEGEMKTVLQNLKERNTESEDEKIRKSIIRLIQRGGYMSPEDKDKAYAWLEKQNKQNPIWSEKEKARIDKIIDILDWAEEKGRISYSDWEDYVCYVKSLKPQSTWKPSEEQMKALNYVINIMASSESPTENDYYYNVFKDMRTHLKKLREE